MPEKKFLIEIVPQNNQDDERYVKVGGEEGMPTAALKVVWQESVEEADHDRRADADL